MKEDDRALAYTVVCPVCFQKERASCQGVFYRTNLGKPISPHLERLAAARAAEELRRIVLS